MIKVLYVCPSSGVGGAETFISQTYSRSQNSEFENHYLFFSTGPLYDLLRNAKAHVHLLNSPPQLSQGSDRKRVHDKIKELINQYNIDLVHSATSLGALFAARTCKQMKTPHVWFQHHPASGWKDRLAALLPHNGLIVNSHYTGKTQRKLENPFRFLIPREFPIEKILLGTPEVTWAENEIDIYRKELLTKIKSDTPEVIIAMVCRIQPWKGVHLLVEAVESLMKHDNLMSFQVMIFGEASSENNDYFQSLKQRAKKNSLPISFPGHIENVSLALAASDIIVNASIQPEAFGHSIVEGMMVGAVPVVPNEGGAAEIVNHGKDGLVFKARQEASLSQQLTTLLKDSHLLQQLSLATQESAKQKYNAKRVIRHLESFHTKIIGH